MIELLIVIAIIGILASVVLVSLNGARAKARDARRLSDMHNISLALELFYAQTGRYPITAGGATWDDHWSLFAACLETGSGCGFTVSGYSPVMSKVPQDPLDDPNTQSDSDPTYYTGWEGRTDQNYILFVRLETNSSALSGDADGSWRPSDSACEDSLLGYCIKQNWPW